MYVTDILQCWISRTGPFICPKSSQMTGFRVGQLSVLELVRALICSYLHPQSELFSSAPARPPNLATSRRSGQLSCSPAFNPSLSTAIGGEGLTGGRASPSPFPDPHTQITLRQRGGRASSPALALRPAYLHPLHQGVVPAQARCKAGLS